MTKYICSHCTGSTGNEHTFVLDREPNYCPWCGQERPVKTIEEYLREQLEDERWEKNHYKDRLEECEDDQ